jgi:hypothetical protein
MIDQAGLLRKLLYSYFRSEGEELIKEEQQQIPGLPAPQSQFGQQVQNTMTAKAAQEIT